MIDPFGQAIHDFHTKGKAPDIQVNTNYTEGENLSVPYLFRSEKEMPQLEKLALKNCRGKILDVGAAAGCHSLALQKKGFHVTALELSEMAVETMKKQNIVNVIQSDIFDYSGKKYDTILLLMNGAGMGGSIAGLRRLLLHLKTLLADGGQILMDSSDIKYLFEEEDGSMWIDLANEQYYGEMQYEVSYKKLTDKFDWLYVDANKLKEMAEETGLQCKIMAEGDHFDYLAQLKF